MARIATVADHEFPRLPHRRGRDFPSGRVGMNGEKVEHLDARHVADATHDALVQEHRADG